MAEGFETPEHRVLEAYYGTAGVPDFSGTDAQIKKWWDVRVPGAKIGTKLHGQEPTMRRPTSTGGSATSLHKPSCCPSSSSMAVRSVERHASSSS